MAHVAAVTGEAIQRWMRSCSQVYTHRVLPKGLPELQAGLCAMMHMLNRTAAMGMELQPALIDYICCLTELVIQLTGAVQMGDTGFVDEVHVTELDWQKAPLQKGELITALSRFSREMANWIPAQLDNHQCEAKRMLFSVTHHMALATDSPLHSDFIQYLLEEIRDISPTAERVAYNALPLPADE